MLYLFSTLRRRVGTLQIFIIKRSTPASGMGKQQRQNNTSRIIKWMILASWLLLMDKEYPSHADTVALKHMHNDDTAKCWIRCGVGVHMCVWGGGGGGRDLNFSSIYYIYQHSYQQQIFIQNPWAKNNIHNTTHHQLKLHRLVQIVEFWKHNTKTQVCQFRTRNTLTLITTCK